MCKGLKRRKETKRKRANGRIKGDYLDNGIYGNLDEYGKVYSSNWEKRENSVIELQWITKEKENTPYVQNEKMRMTLSMCSKL